MTSLSRRMELIRDYDEARRSHKPRAQLVAELKALTTKQIRNECRWGWLRRYKPSERTIAMIGIGLGSVIYVLGLLFCYAPGFH